MNTIEEAIEDIKKGRIVFGGGGIKPDINISRDTLLNFSVINKIIMKGWIRDFSMQYSDDNRDNVFKITNSKEYLNRIQKIIFNQFINYINRFDSNITKDLKSNDIEFLEKQIIANIARNIWSNEDYYRIILDDDEFILKAYDN